MSISPTTVAQTLLSPPLEVLAEHELTSGVSVTDYVQFLGVAGFGLVVRFDAIPVEFGYHIGAVNYYYLPLVSISFAHYARIYATAEAHYGDFLLWPLPQGPLLATPNADLAFRFTPGVYGRIWALNF